MRKVYYVPLPVSRTIGNFDVRVNKLLGKLANRGSSMGNGFASLRNGDFVKYAENVTVQNGYGDTYRNDTQPCYNVFVGCGAVIANGTYSTNDDRHSGDTVKAFQRRVVNTAHEVTAFPDYVIKGNSFVRLNRRCRNGKNFGVSQFGYTRYVRFSTAAYLTTTSYLIVI